MEYDYSPELKAPEKTIDFDLSRPGTLAMLKLLVMTHRKQADSFCPPEGVRLSRITLGSVPCFVAEPEGETDLPALVYCHGGGFYLPVQATSLALACVYARQCHVRVYLPEYRLVPAYPAPAALEDCIQLWQQLTEERKLLYGESAGGTLAAGLALYIRDHGLNPPAGQCLIYPALDNRPEAYPSFRTYPNAAWSLRSNTSMWEAYLKSPEEAWLPYLVPMGAASLAALPQTYLEPQQIDVLCDEAIAYGKRLEQAGVAVEVHKIPGSYHGFDSDLSSPLVTRVLNHRVAVISKMLYNQEKEV